MKTLKSSHIFSFLKKQTKKQINFKGATITRTAGISTEITEARKQRYDTSKWEENDLLHSFIPKDEGKRKTLYDKTKMREFVTSRPALKKILMVVFQAQ